MSNQTAQGIALVTGSSSGIGEAFAAHLAAAGYNLVLVARRRDRLETQAKLLSSEHGISADVFVADLANPNDLAQVERLANEKPLSMLVNNAGVGGIAPFDEMPRDEIQRMLDVNVIALTRLTHAALPGMVDRRRGTIINVGSGLSFATMPNAAVYAATKAYVVHFTQALHEEFDGRDIRLQALIPGLVRTELGSGKNTAFYDQFPPEMVMSPDALVAASLTGLNLGELVCIPVLTDPLEWAAANDAIRQIGQRVATAVPAVPSDRYSRSV